MVLFFLILNNYEHLEEVLEILLELGIEGATVLDSVGMGQLLAADVPIFAGLKDLMPGSRPYNKTIFTLTQAENVPMIVEAVEQVTGNLNESGSGVAFSVKLDFVKGVSQGL